MHTVEINHGETTERHLCAEHADRASLGIPAGFTPVEIALDEITRRPAHEAAVRGIVDNLRGTANFIGRYGRMPSCVDELLQGMALPDDLSMADIADPNLQRQLAWMEDVIRFCEAHGRMPETDEEMPPPPISEPQP